MTDPKVRYVRKLAGHPTEGLAWLAGQDQIERGLRRLDRNIPGVNWDYEGLWIDVDGECVALMSFKRQDWNRHITTGWSFTLPEHRRRGYNRALFDALQHIAKRDGYHTIERGTHPKNAAMIAAFESAGGEQSYVHFNFDVGINLDSLNDRYEFP